MDCTFLLQRFRLVVVCPNSGTCALYSPAFATRAANDRLTRYGGLLQFEAPARYPNFAMPQRLTPDPGCWVNECLATYLQANSVIVSNTTEDCPR